MEPHLLDSFAAHMVGTTLDQFTRDQRTSAPRPRRRAGAQRRRGRGRVAGSATAPE